MAPVFIGNGNGSFNGSDSCANNGSTNISSEGWISGGGLGAEVRCDIRSPIEWGTGRDAVVAEVLPPDPEEIYRTADKLCGMLAFSGGTWGRLGQSIRVALEGDVSKQYMPDATWAVSGIPQVYPEGRATLRF